MEPSGAIDAPVTLWTWFERMLRSGQKTVGQTTKQLKSALSAPNVSPLTVGEKYVVEHACNQANTVAKQVTVAGRRGFSTVECAGK